MTQIITISATKFPFKGSLKMQGCKEHVRFRRYGRVKHQANIKEQPQYNVARNSYMMYVHLRFRGFKRILKYKYLDSPSLPEDCFPTLLELSGVCQLEHLLTS